MSIDRHQLGTLFEDLGRELREQTTLCIFGSAPAILLGQRERQTQDIDVWHSESTYDAGDLRRACIQTGVLYDPKDELDHDQVYVQIVRPGIVALPQKLDVETIARYGNLTVTMPAPVVLSAAKLVRLNDRDVQDVVWWIRHRSIDMGEVLTAVQNLPDPRHREIAQENLILVQLVAAEDE